MNQGLPMNQGGDRNQQPSAASAVICGQAVDAPAMQEGRNARYALLAVRVFKANGPEDFRVALFGDLAKVAVLTVNPGDGVAVFGSLAMRRRTSRDGQEYAQLAFQATGLVKLQQPQPQQPQPVRRQPLQQPSSFTVGFQPPAGAARPQEPPQDDAVPF